jgi:hypothetical protein
VKGATESASQLGFSFFGLTSETAPQARAALFTQIHEIVFHGKGGYDWNTVYNMPIWLRKFTFNRIREFYKEESESIANQTTPNNGKKTLVDPSGNVNAPEFLQASKQYKRPAKYK